MTRSYPRASRYRDRHGKWRWRYQHRRRSWQLGTEYGSEEFIRLYEAADREASGKSERPSRCAPGTFNALVETFYRSPAFQRLSPSTRATYSGIIDRFRQEKDRGNKLVKDLRRRDVIAIMSSMSDTPAAANNLLRMLRMLMKLAIQLEWRDTDPTLGVDKFPTGPGFHTWTEAEIARFYACHKPGTLAHTAMTLMLCTGAARADVVRLGWGNVAEDRIQYRRQKMLTRDGMLIDIRILPELAEVLSALPRDHFTFLQTRHGSSRSPKAFGGLMRKWCDAAGLPECTSHGLRKAIARRLGDAGATPHMIASITGHKSIKEVAHYSEDYDRARSADEGFDRLSRTKPAQKVANLPRKSSEPDGK